MPQCKACGETRETLRSLKRHHRRYHSGETWTPEEHLPDDGGDQRDFDGDVPDDSDHDPEYETTNDVDRGERGHIFDFVEEDDDVEG